jgi:hypothetical protein
MISMFLWCHFHKLLKEKNIAGNALNWSDHVILKAQASTLLILQDAITGAGQTNDKPIDHAQWRTNRWYILYVRIRVSNKDGQI